MTTATIVLLVFCAASVGFFVGREIGINDAERIISELVYELGENANDDPAD